MAPRRSTAVATVTQPVRAAIYTRKSTEEGLDQEFNSLDAQRDAAEAYIASQRHEGWAALPERYDDGGFSGATMERPALKRLLDDVAAGDLDCVVVYKLDRLSRSVRDYLNLLAFLDEHDVAFVSVTQQFNTTSPVGRMTLRMLLSFAEFERDIIAERTRDKIQAARRRGRWTGGFAPLGYDVAPEGGRLVVNKNEAQITKALFELYVETPSIGKVCDELKRRGWRQKSWTTKGGKRREGRPWNRSSLRRLLTNPVVIGKIPLGDETFAGEHDGVVPKKLFDKVQRLMERNRRTGGASQRNRHGALLRGLLHCSACGTNMTHAPVNARGKLHRYYRCNHAMRSGAAACPGKPVKADEVEGFVIDQIRRIGASPELQAETFRQATLQLKAKRRGLMLDARRVADELARARADVERLVAVVSRLDGAAADAVAAELGKAQEHVAALETRQTEVAAELDAAKAMDVDRDAVARALAEFGELWSVLLTPERERILRLLIEQVDYRGDTGDLSITWRLSGIGEFAAEVAR